MTGALHLPADGLTVGTTQVAVKRGNLGIGVTPDWSISGNLQLSSGGSISAANAVGLYANAYFNAGWKYINTGEATGYGQSSGAHTWSNAGQGTAGAPATLTTAMTLDASGNLGLGVTPSAWGGTSKALQFPSGAIEARGTSLAIANNAYFNGTSWTHADAGAATAYNQDHGNHYWYSAPAGTAGAPITFMQPMRLEATGDLTISGANATKAGAGGPWLGASDVRLKDNIQPFTKGLNEILRVDVKTWEYNGKGGTVAGMKGLGVIADEVMQVLPDTVDTYSAKLTPDDEEEIDIKRFNGNEITWLLVNSIKEQQATITDLQTRLAALEAKP
jgi:hypothetical protein